MTVPTVAPSQKAASDARYVNVTQTPRNPWRGWVFSAKDRCQTPVFGAECGARFLVGVWSPI